jgi:hypothetical protein
MKTTLMYGKQGLAIAARCGCSLSHDGTGKPFPVSKYQQLGPIELMK